MYCERRMSWCYCFLANTFLITFKYLQNIAILCFHFVKLPWKKYMLEADENGRMLFLHNEFLLYIFKCKWNRGTRHLLTKISIFVNSVTRTTCCNARLNIMMKRWKYRMANILNCRAIFHRFWSSRKQKQQLLEAETLNFKVLMECSK